MKVSVSEHKTLNTSKGIIKDRNPGVTLPPCRGLWGTLHIWGRY